VRCTDFWGDNDEAAPRMLPFILPLDLESTNPAENVTSFMEQVLGIERTSEATMMDLDESTPVVSETLSDGVNSEADDDMEDIEDTTTHALLKIAVAKALSDGGVTTSGYETPAKKNSQKLKLDAKLDFTWDTGSTTTPNSGSLRTPGEWESEPESAKLGPYVAKTHWPTLGPYGPYAAVDGPYGPYGRQFRRPSVEHIVRSDVAEDCYSRFYE